MKMIVGLGNPGNEYVGTRHNVGFETLDRLSEKTGIGISSHKMKGVTGSGFIEGEKVILVKPLTYMNLSGECVGEVASFFKIQPCDIIVISDDIDLPVGGLRIREKGSAGGHNGLKSIIAHLHSEDFSRVRVGVGAKHRGQDLAAHVLSHFHGDELELMAEAEEDAVEAVLLMVKGETSRAMNRYNRRERVPASE